ncbi:MULTISPECIES: LysR family transcriptional regulator [unclassified Mesorhizobium]|nr:MULTISPECIES: LysR family transcriptional regulator [unclassified Mesorhizobium]
MAFESAARHGGIMRAADDLHLSQSAVSRLVKQVEDAVQVKLFDRVRQRLVPTEAGRTYARQLRKILIELEQTTLQIMAYGSGGEQGTLNLGVFSTFGTKWLIPRLEEFRQSNPNIVVSCYVRSRPFSFDEDPLDAAIHYGEPIWPNAVVEPLFGEALVPIASPHLPGIEGLKEAKDVLSFPILHEVTRPWAWNQWFEQETVQISGTLLGARFDQFQMIAQAAKSGLGIALVPRFLFESEIASGELFVPLNKPLIGDSKYYLVYPHRNSASPSVLSFKSWLLKSAQQEQTSPGALAIKPEIRLRTKRKGSP